MIRLTRKGVMLQSSAEWMEGLREQFATRHYVLLPQLVERELFREILSEIKDSNFISYTHETLGSETQIQEGFSITILHFLMNMPGFTEFLGEVTGCGAMGHFAGRIYRLVEANEQQFDWHDDVISGTDRVLALSMNLSGEPFQGGELQLRNQQTGEILGEVANTGFGDAVIFRVADGLEHRVLGVRGKNPKLAFVGWYHANKNLHTLIREKVAAGQAKATHST